jgi:hypothetical protein
VFTLFLFSSSNLFLLPLLFLRSYLGFANAMLGVTGFETSANFVEEQKEGVFVLTLRFVFILAYLIF